MSNAIDRARIVVGSIFSFTLYLRDGDGNPVSLAPYTAAKLAFRNSAGTRTEITLTTPGANPDRGALAVSGSATDADEKWASADLELTSNAGLTLIPLNNKFEIVKRNVPAAS